MPVTTFNISGDLNTKFDDLQKHYGASSKAEILRKAITFLDLAKDSEQPDGTVVINKGDEQITVTMK